MTPTQETLIALGLFAASELLALSKFKDNSVLQLVLHMLGELFPYELTPRQRPTKQTRPRIKRDSHGRYLPREEDGE